MKTPIFKRSALATCTSSLILLSAMLGSSGAAAHGYVEFPPSRALLCQKGVNTGCGGASNEPQSVGETFKGFPAGVGGAVAGAAAGHAGPASVPPAVRLAGE